MAADDRLNEPQTEDALLARRLRDAHRRVRALALPQEEQARLARRLLAICDVAKRDIAHAAARLDVFIAYLDGASDTPSRRNMPPGD
ncbi:MULTISPECIES: hypothetical protein [Microbispora]|uniref:Uncharacterized protein n=4 Tax=Microbispora TaxID=2005 RepID=A0ABY3LQQ1_9ACTN|nr:MULTISPECIES: hypothetical protein [Microbispora]RGA06042.1 hypothetical protein DI270_005285 [Microbispora triticiradicis]TLP51872.1 hypothetical protein FED44_32985 [Microbispora fusca]TYB50379.1 hypothetical protein FXF59_28720 [Microbispora tritici]GLW24476.1 hypothetical protein Mame01_45190 [Microbispora amethystogenes]